MVKTEFSIKDLENLSGVKAHTIRIWEKRYDLFCPERTETNIRKYNLDSLKKLLNVTQLYNQGHKISKIASLSDLEISKLSKDTSTESLDAYLINKFKTAMFSFDNELFEKTFAEMEERYSFKQSFEEVLIPLLLELGQLWLIGTIHPVHERYISELIRLKTCKHIDTSLQRFKKKSNVMAVLFLPQNESHELGLLYAQYLTINAGLQTLYLGGDIPLKGLTHITKQHSDVVFMTYVTTEPSSLDQYLDEFNKTVCAEKKYNLLCFGSKTNEINQDNVTSNINIITQIQDFNNHLIQLADA